jgi:prepilin-type N-terminal cleavage/methylation domain-containing protein
LMTAPSIFFKPARGFTLLEVMVALVVMAVTLVTLLQLHSGTIRLAGAGRFTGMIPVLAQGLLADQLAGPSGVLDQSGNFGPEYGGLEWTCTIENAALEDPALLSDQQMDRLKKIQLTISAPGTGRTSSLTFWRYRVDTDD